MKCYIDTSVTFIFFQDAKKDEAVRKAYKYLAALHEVRKITLIFNDVKLLVIINNLRVSATQSKPIISDSVQNTARSLSEHNDFS